MANDDLERIDRTAVLRSLEDFKRRCEAADVPVEEIRKMLAESGIIVEEKDAE